MNSSILNEAYQEISEDNKLIRLATLTTIIYSIIFVIYIMYQVNFIISQWEWHWETINIAIQYINYFVENLKILWIAFIWWIILAIWYFLLPPIADWALISYVKSEDKSWRKALMKWFLNFFPMFEYNAMIWVVNFLVYFIAVTRAYSMWILDNLFMQILLWIWWIMIIFASIFFHYSKFLIILNWMWPIEAIKKSSILTFMNFWITFKFVIINYLLYIRFIINIIILIFIPWAIIYVSNMIWVFDNMIIKYITYSIFIILIILTAYINGIIEAFFINYWYKVFKKINKEEI